MSFHNWDEIRTAYHVARTGTVSGAAGVLGVHHATVIRHVDALESRLGLRLFHRHARGYTPTEAGEALFAAAAEAEEGFARVAGRLRGQGAGLRGELVVTVMPHLAPILCRVLSGFAQAHPDLRLRVVTDTRLLALERGEAHVALRAGPRPSEPDNVVQPLAEEQVALYASRSYRAAEGPLLPGDWGRHRFVGPDDDSPNAPYLRWMAAHVPEERIVLRSGDLRAGADAVRAGIGIGFLPMAEAGRDPDLVQMAPPDPGWQSPLWLVSHVDLHRTPPVQTLLVWLKERADQWTRP